MRSTSETVRHLARAAGAFVVVASTAVVLAGGSPAAAMGGETYGDNDASTCVEAQRAGDTIASGQVSSRIENKKYLTVTGVGDYVVTSIVVKGGSSYNAYSVSDLGELPWKRLHAPDDERGEPAEISHWFLCGTKSEPSTTTTGVTTTTTSPGTTTTTSPGTTTTTSPGSTTTTTGASITTPGSTTSGSPTPSTSPSTTTPATRVTSKSSTPVAAAGSKDDLASTGFGSMWLLLLGGGLVAAGIAFVASPKLRGLLRR